MSESDIVKAISTNNLDTIKKVITTSTDANKPLFTSADILIKTPAGHSPFYKIRGANSVILSILYEKPEILKHLLTNFEIDYSFTVNGWNALHFAACTKDYKCLKVLLECSYFQEHIDEKIIQNIDDNQFGFTTALHVAATNRRHAQAIILTQDLPEITIINENLQSPFSAYDSSVNQPANPSILSMSGNTALHIAAYQKDWDMCQILLNASADPHALNKNGKTPIDIARDRKYTDLANKLERDEYHQINTFVKKYLGEEMKKEEKEKEDKEEIMELKATIKNLTGLIEQLTEKVTAYEEKAEEKKTEVCQQCGYPMTNGKCPNCN